MNLTKKDILDFSERSNKPKVDYWNDQLVTDFYLNYYDNLTSKELDREFRKDVKSLTNSLQKLSDNERKAVIEILAKFIDFYVNQKVEKELDKSFFKILKF